MGIIKYLRKDAVLTVSAFAALVSAFFVPPSPGYLGYIDFHTLCLLLSLMLVVEGLKSAGVMEFVLGGMLKFAKNTRILTYILVLLCFFSSMLITNDVALITFVPLAVMLLKKTDNKKLMIPVIVLQTVAANLGSMLTPLGNPQNLYLYSVSGMSFGQFIKITFPTAAASFVLTVIAVLFIKPEKVYAETRVAEINQKAAWLWMLMFAVCLLSVLHILPTAAALAAVAAAALLYDRKMLKKADYGLLLTFVFFFIFVGNMQKIPAVSDFLSLFTQGREKDVGILLSQIISNVPAAILLSGFTQNYPMLITGVNLGGLGTLIASMASLISYKLYAAEEPLRKGRFLAVFTTVNVIFLIILRFFSNFY